MGVHCSTLREGIWLLKVGLWRTVRPLCTKVKLMGFGCTLLHTQRGYLVAKSQSVAHGSTVVHDVKAAGAGVDIAPHAVRVFGS